MSNTLQAGSSLTVGQSLSSDNGAYTLTLQDDGNLVLSDGGNAVWASKTNGKSVTKAALQDDGNFVLYTDGNDAAWASETSGNSGVRLVLQDDRNVVLYAGDNAVWSTNTKTDTPTEAPAPVEPAPVEPAPAAPAAPAPAAQTHTIVSGDTLWDLAQRFYGDGNQFQRIADANGIPNPDAINVGQVLTIPA